jgi:hypothetical protein
VENIILVHSIVNTLIIGDFNVSGFSCTDYAQINDPNPNIIISSFINYLNLKQVNSILNDRFDILDLIMTNNCVDCIRLGSSLIPLIDSYHSPLDFILSISTPEFLSETSCPIVFNFNACNYNDVNLFLNSIDLMSNLKKS